MGQAESMMMTGLHGCRGGCSDGTLMGTFTLTVVQPGDLMGLSKWLLKSAGFHIVASTPKDLPQSVVAVGSFGIWVEGDGRRSRTGQGKKPPQMEWLLQA
jgi:hypothetical protein